mmetsp:Transcript_113117/g.314898  ORF Transcript_113117/g.314898 Transcript_113117/m.314898 type:complete len:231 (+) Transcript_113117:806-1498(+)
MAHLRAHQGLGPEARVLGVDVRGGRLRGAHWQPGYAQGLGAQGSQALHIRCHVQRAHEVAGSSPPPDHHVASSTARVSLPIRARRLEADDQRDAPPWGENRAEPRPLQLRGLPQRPPQQHCDCARGAGHHDLDADVAGPDAADVREPLPGLHDRVPAVCDRLAVAGRCRHLGSVPGGGHPCPDAHRPRGPMPDPAALLGHELPGLPATSHAWDRRCGSRHPLWRPGPHGH